MCPILISIFQRKTPTSGGRPGLRLRIPENSQLRFCSMEAEKPLIRPGGQRFLTLVKACLWYLIPLAMLNLAEESLAPPAGGGAGKAELSDFGTILAMEHDALLICASTI